MRALVTGATGFLGRHLVEALRREGVDVVAFRGDVRDPAAFVDLPRVDIVHHLAARSAVQQSIVDPATSWAVNVDGTLRVLEWARASGCSRVVLASSVQVYGQVQRTPVDEAHPARPVTPYGASKLAAEALAHAYHATYGLETVALRVCNAYGPGQRPGALVPELLRQIREGKGLVVGDPAPVRDFVFARDVAEAFARAGVAKEAAGRVLNVGTGRGTAVGDVAKLLLAISGSSEELRVDPAAKRAAEPRELVVDVRAARDALAWSPQTSLEEGLRQTWEAPA